MQYNNYNLKLLIDIDRHNALLKQGIAKGKFFKNCNKGKGKATGKDVDEDKYKELPPDDNKEKNNLLPNITVSPITA